jgi:hypothetical protein
MAGLDPAIHDLKGRLKGRPHYFAAELCALLQLSTKHYVSKHFCQRHPYSERNTDPEKKYQARQPLLANDNNSGQINLLIERQ